MAGLLSFLILVLDTVATVIVLEESRDSTQRQDDRDRGPGHSLVEGPGWFKVFSAAVMLTRRWRWRSSPPGS
ncbi:MAG: hypothetical protein WKF40_02885 [Thermoleophilaceae bacterium]